MHGKVNVCVAVPPTVQSAVPKGQLTTRRGGTVTLTCTASGNPMPNILWTKKVFGLSHTFNKTIIQSCKGWLTES